MQGLCSQFCTLLSVTKTKQSKQLYPYGYEGQGHYMTNKMLKWNKVTTGEVVLILAMSAVNWLSV